MPRSTGRALSSAQPPLLSLSPPPAYPPIHPPAHIPPPHLLAAGDDAEAVGQAHRLVAVAHPHQLRVLLLCGKERRVAHHLQQ